MVISLALLNLVVLWLVARSIVDRQRIRELERDVGVLQVDASPAKDPCGFDGAA